MPVDAINSTNHTQSPYLPGAERVPKKTLGQEDFFKLLAVQLSSQDPMKPMEDTDFIAQMSSFSSLDMMGKMSSGVLALTTQQSYLNAQTLLGRTVTATDADGVKVTGLATAIHTADDGSSLVTINGKEYAAATITRVELAPSTTGEGSN